MLPVAAFEFKRRRRTLLWLDDRPHANISTLQLFPGCPDPADLTVPSYPMREHCALCKHGLTMDSNPKASAKERERLLIALEQERDKVLNAARRGDPDAVDQLPKFVESVRQAQAYFDTAQSAADAIEGDFAGRDIKMEEQTDVVLFTSVTDMTHFLRVHPELSKCLPPHSPVPRFISAQLFRLALTPHTQLPHVAAAHCQQLRAFAHGGWSAGLFRHRPWMASQVHLLSFRCRVLQCAESD